MLMRPQWTKLYQSDNVQYADGYFPPTHTVVEFVLNKGSLDYSRYGFVTQLTYDFEGMEGHVFGVLEFARGLEERKFRIYHDIERYRQIDGLKAIPEGVLRDITLAENKRFLVEIGLTEKDLAEQEFFGK